MFRSRYRQWVIVLPATGTHHYQALVRCDLINNDLCLFDVQFYLYGMHELNLTILRISKGAERCFAALKSNVTFMPTGLWYYLHEKEKKAKVDAILMLIKQTFVIIISWVRDARVWSGICGRPIRWTIVKKTNKIISDISPVTIVWRSSMEILLCMICILTVSTLEDQDDACLDIGWFDAVSKHCNL